DISQLAFGGTLIVTRVRLSAKFWESVMAFAGPSLLYGSEKVSFRIVAADHTGITVSSLEGSLAFWRDVLGFEFSHRAHQTGKMAEEITGVKGAEIKLAVVKAPGGHKIELLEYLAPPDRKKQLDL